MIFTHDGMSLFGYMLIDMIVLNNVSYTAILIYAYFLHTTDSIATRMLDTFVDFHGDSESPIRIDTARIYAAGESERQLGCALSKLDDNDKPITSSKAHPSQPDGLSPKGIRAQLESSLDAVKYLSSFGEYYLHQPDEDHDLLDSLKTLNQLIDEGKIYSIGMSNYHASEVQRAFDLCDEHGLANKPTVYQGLYNPLNRLVENELIPILKKNSCNFVAYNPLAAGLLTGKHSSSGKAALVLFYLINLCVQYKVSEI